MMKNKEINPIKRDTLNIGEAPLILLKIKYNPTKKPIIIAK
jgi:hypothetical protein